MELTNRDELGEELAAEDLEYKKTQVFEAALEWNRVATNLGLRPKTRKRRSATWLKALSKACKDLEKSLGKSD